MEQTRRSQPPAVEAEDLMRTHLLRHHLKYLEGVGRPTSSTRSPGAGEISLSVVRLVDDENAEIFHSLLRAEDLSRIMQALALERAAPVQHHSYFRDFLIFMAIFFLCGLLSMIIDIIREMDKK
ncbi:hypothetical protein VKT23_012617 [Stygiomarasmius scandens]|uniref:Uncharacterized protein n=1 Tax=Marasmiellus scandens TaxID=2682957 RepID=A0ABR1J6D9_9AGAR